MLQLLLCACLQTLMSDALMSGRALVASRLTLNLLNNDMHYHYYLLALGRASCRYQKTQQNSIRQMNEIKDSLAMSSVCMHIL